MFGTKRKERRQGGRKHQPTRERVNAAVKIQRLPKEHCRLMSRASQWRRAEEGKERVRGDGDGDVREHQKPKQSRADESGGEISGNIGGLLSLPTQLSRLPTGGRGRGKGTCRLCQLPTVSRVRSSFVEKTVSLSPWTWLGF